MYKRILVGIGVAGILVASGGLLAQPTSALTIDELQTQIKELLAKVASLQLQIKTAVGGQTQPTDPTGVMPTPNKHRICSILYRNLSQGTQGDDVASLQEFLSAEGYLSANATGYFGPMTAQAVAKWQASQGVSAVGSFGPMSRERVKVWCGTADRFSATPQRGTAPLLVLFKTVAEQPRTSSYYSIDFGDGSSTGEMIGPCPMGLGGGECSPQLSAQHLYTSNGTYTAVLYKIDRGGCTPEAEAQGCLGSPASRTAVAKVQIYVGANVGCTKEYMPVCGSKPIVCITTPCNPTQQTYSNRCTMNADGATFVHEGACRDTKPAACTMEYAPVCGRPPCPGDPNLCGITAPQTYSNRCQMNAAGATLLYSGSCSTDKPVACTMDAKQCPDGSYVGRTGPNCQFVCPSY